MTEIQVVGLGMWSPVFSNWGEFSNGINTGEWQPAGTLQPALIPAKERRRAPQSVKLAVEVMTQACEMASLDPAGTAAVFSSAMGDMQITDYLCRTLATTPRAVSPTKFHNSVHNATTGYWSIASQSHAASNAVSAYTYTASMAFLEAAIQTLEEHTPVLLVTQEMAAPKALCGTCPSNHPFSAAMLLAPTGTCSKSIASVEFNILKKTCDWPKLPNDLDQLLDENFGSRLVPLLAAIVSNTLSIDTTPVNLEFPLTASSCLKLSVSARSQPD